MCDIVKRPDASDATAPPPELLPAGEEVGGEGLGEGGVSSEKDARD